MAEDYAGRQIEVGDYVFYDGGDYAKVVDINNRNGVETVVTYRAHWASYNKTASGPRGPSRMTAFRKLLVLHPNYVPEAAKQVLDG